MSLRSLLSTLLLLACSAGAWGQVAGFDWTGSAGLTHRRLVERAASGATLVVEDGPVGRLGLRGERALTDQGAALALEATLAGGLLDYRGQVQFTGAPLSTRTAHVDTDLEVLLRPLAPAAWGEAWLSFGRLDNRRYFHGTAATRPLYERSAALMLGARWRSPAYTPVRGWTVGLEADAKASVSHRVYVNFYGLTSPSHLAFDGGDKHLVKLRMHAQASGSPWTWTLEWARMKQGVSEPTAARGSGIPVALCAAPCALTVFQPELSMRDVSLVLSRRF